MSRLLRKRTIETPDLGKIGNGIRKLEQSLSFQQALINHQNCICPLCRSKKDYSSKKQKINTFQKNEAQNSEKWLLKLMNGLSCKDAPTLKLYIPDLCFIQGDSLQVFYTDPRDNRFKKMEGFTPIKALYLTMLRLKKKYKEMLQQNFQKNFLNDINPEFVHQKYIEQVLPSHFDSSENRALLQSNKRNFMRYILHKDKKLLIQSIEEHKLNENQPFCMIKYKDGNMQLFSKKQFETYTCVRISSDIVYVQSYIKQKQLQVSNFTSCYSFYSDDIDIQLFDKADKEILILIGGIGKYNEGYEDIDVLQDNTIQLMKSNIPKYVKFMTYKIVNYLAMVVRIYVKHIKINWVLNDLGMVYIQSIFEYQTSDIPLRTLKYRLPPKEENLVFYKDSQNFLKLYKQVQMMRQVKRNKIRKQLQKQAQENGSQYFSTVDQSYQSSSVRKKSQFRKLSNTIDTSNLNNAYSTNKKNQKYNRYIIPKTNRLQFLQKKQRTKHRSVLDKLMC